MGTEKKVLASETEPPCSRRAFADGEGRATRALLSWLPKQGSAWYGNGFSAAQNRPKRSVPQRGRAFSRSILIAGVSAFHCFLAKRGSIAQNVHLKRCDMHYLLQWKGSLFARHGGGGKLIAPF